MRYLLLFPIFLGTLVNAQTDTSAYPVWVDMMRDPNVNLNKVTRAFELYWQDREVTKGSGYKPFKRWQYHMSKQVDEAGNLPPEGHVYKTMSEYQYTRSTSGNWRPLGPNFNQVTELGDISGVGRINTIAFDPLDPTVIYAGAPQGGLWRSTDNGEHWNPLTDQLPSLGVSSIAIDPNDPNIIYIGTGDRDANDAEGLGVFKSEDGGVTWNQMNTGMGNVIVGEMRLHPDSSGILIAATSGGMYRTTDSAVTWTKTTIISHYYEDLEFHPTNPNIVYAIGSARLYRSTDNGLSWSFISGFPAVSRMMITVTPDDPDRVYALLTNQRSFHSFYMSVDAGVSFTRMSDSPNIMGYNVLGNDTGGQSWYDATVAADPNDADVVYVGGIHVFKSYDKGVTWKHNSPNMHVDHHYLAFSPHTSEIYMGNDGGVYRSDAGNNEWEDISGNMVVGQIYKIGQSATNVNKVLNGFQDNGTNRYDGVGWIRELGADGMECQVDQYDENYMYASIYYGSIRRSTNNGASFARIAAQNENGITEEGAWVTPFTIAEQDNDVMYAGYESVWRTTNLKAPDNDDVLWEKISGNLGSTKFSVIEHSPADTDVLYGAKGTTTIYRSDNCNASAAGVTWVSYSSGMLYGGAINDLEAHPRDADVVYMVKGNGVLKSTNRGQTWTDITLNLPAVTKTCMVFDTTTAEGLYVGTMSGVYYKDSAMANWEFYGNGMPASSEITEIEIYYGNGTSTKRLRAATYGRGLWESDGYGVTTYNYAPKPVFTFVENNPKRHVRGTFQMNIGFYKNLDNIDVAGFIQSEIVVSNATVTALSGGPSDFVATFEPIMPGTITMHIPSGVATDADNVSNLESEFFEVYYSPEYPVLGYTGPGGVGSAQQLAIWLDPLEGVMTHGGVVAANTGDDITGWLDKSVQNILVEQTNSNNYPFYLKGQDGITGIDAIGLEVDTADEGDYLVARDVRPGMNLAGFSVAETSGNYFTNHGWLASARGKSGFVMHPVNNSRNYYVSVMDDNEGYWSGYNLLVEDTDLPHVYGFMYCQNPLFKYQVASVDGVTIDRKLATGTGRDDNALVDVRYGWDYDQRWGEGKLGEHILYNTEMGLSHFRIVRNYLAAKYRIDLGLEDLFAYDTYFRFNLGGIGRENEFDQHLDAQGTGIIRMTAASLNDGEYLLWADTDAAVDSWLAGKTPYTSKRVSRTWRVDETNDVGAVEVRIDKSLLALSTDTYAILTSNSMEINSGLYAHALTDGDTLHAVIDFDDGAYFTIISATDEEIKFINEEYSELSIAAHPSLSNGNFDLYVRNVNELNGTVQLYNLIGQLVMEKNVSGSKTVRIEVAALESGQYIARYRDNNSGSTVFTKAVVVK